MSREFQPSRRQENVSHYYERIRRQPLDPIIGQSPPWTNQQAALSGLVKSREWEWKRKERGGGMADLSRPVTGSYSIYDGNRMEESLNELSITDDSFGIPTQEVKAVVKFF